MYDQIIFFVELLQLYKISNMAESRQIICTYIHSGSLSIETYRLNAESSIDQILQEIRRLFRQHLPDRFSFEFYGAECFRMIKLDESILESGSNPFLLNSSNSIQNMPGVNQLVQLFVINDDDKKLKQGVPSVSGSYTKDAATPVGINEFTTEQTSDMQSAEGNNLSFKRDKSCELFF